VAVSHEHLADREAKIRDLSTELDTMKRKEATAMSEVVAAARSAAHAADERSESVRRADEAEAALAVSRESEASLRRRIQDMARQSGADLAHFRSYIVLIFAVMTEAAEKRFAEEAAAMRHELATAQQAATAQLERARHLQSTLSQVNAGTATWPPIVCSASCAHLWCCAARSAAEAAVEKLRGELEAARAAMADQTVAIRLASARRGGPSPQPPAAAVAGGDDSGSDSDTSAGLSMLDELEQHVRDRMTGFVGPTSATMVDSSILAVRVLTSLSPCVV
jgi:hypothetical protein